MKECNNCVHHKQGAHPAMTPVRGMGYEERDGSFVIPTCLDCLDHNLYYFKERPMIHAHIPVFTAGDSSATGVGGGDITVPLHFASSPKLPTDAAKRKAAPVTTGVLDYFPQAIAAVAELSRVGNEQHHPGAPLHWDRTKSTDHSDCLARHLMERGTLDTDGIRHSTKVAWRALAMLQLEIEREGR